MSLQSRAPSRIFTTASDEQMQQDVQVLVSHLIERLGMVGLLAVEMFVTREGQVLVNEVAPKPHNRSHQTIEGNFTSQFEQHLRAILNGCRPGTDAALSSRAAPIGVVARKRRHRKMQKSVYRVRNQCCLKGRIAFDMLRESRAEGRAQTTKVLHKTRRGQT